MSDLDWIATPVDLLIGYEPGMKLPQRGKTWHPDERRQHRMPTETAYWTWRAASSQGRRWQALTNRISRVLKDRKLLAECRLKIRRLIDNGTIDMSDIPDKDAARAELGLAYCAALIESTEEGVNASLKLKAAQTLLTFVKAKPAQKIDATVRKAEDLLDELPDD